MENKIWGRLEIQRKIEENAKILQEWTELIDKNEKMAPKDIPNNDILSHQILKKKLHENLGRLAKVVQMQLSQKKIKESSSNLNNVSNSNLETESVRN
jgi:hypothetical protein